MSDATRKRQVMTAALISLSISLALGAAPALAGRSHPLTEGKSCAPTPSPYLPRGSSQPAGSLSGPALARCQGGFGYTDRPTAVRHVLDRMYANDHRYRTFSALFVDRLPGDTPSSVRLYVSQPHSGVAALYSSTAGAGKPREVWHAYGESLDQYSPAAGVFTTNIRVLQPLPLPPLETLPPNIQQGDFTTVSFADATSTHGAIALADLFVQPSGLITDALFTQKTVTLHGSATVDGRSTWILEGTQIPTVPLGSGEPLAWRMWVDQRTGTILRLQYLRRNHVVGQAAMRQVRIDGAGSSTGGGDAFAGWTVPASARYVAPLEYGAAQSPNGSGPIDWARHHVDIVLQIALILLLIVLWWIAGRFQPPELRRGSPAGTPNPSD
ncbi:MAG TPA: hypothetical protein VF898_10510 [Chloroflexota bacterium]